MAQADAGSDSARGAAASHASGPAKSSASGARPSAAGGASGGLTRGATSSAPAAGATTHLSRVRVATGVASTASAPRAGVKSAVAYARPAAAVTGAAPRHQLVNGELFLGGAYIELGISSVGSLGTQGGKPSDFYGGNGSRIGLAYEQDGLGGTDPRLDFTLPDDPEERWSIGYDDANYGGFSALNGNWGNATTLTDQSLTDNSSGNTLSGISQVTVNGALKVTQTQTFDANSTFYKTTVTLTNVSGAVQTNVEYMRSADPDNTRAYGGDNATINGIGANTRATVIPW
ncbi:hypothetical protein B1R94_15315 [Mycolicibacterium litorale]|nr:hypothetical protein B1R94_15315 [Mycolicibacterium litorale]